MEASKISFFKKTKEQINKPISSMEKGKLRLEKFMKTCPEGGVPRKEAMKICGYDPTIKKEYNSGNAFLNYHIKNKNIITIPVIDSIKSKRPNVYFAPNLHRIKQLPYEENVEKRDKIKEAKKEIEQKISSAEFEFECNDNTYTFNLKDMNKSEIKEKISKLLEII